MHSRQNLALSALVLVVLIAHFHAFAAPEPKTNAAPGHLLLLDSLGRSVIVFTNEVHLSLHPSSDSGLKPQVPAAPRGAAVPAAICQHIVASKAGELGIQWFPATPTALLPYLDNHPTDLIVLATHQHEGRIHWLQQSVAESIARQAAQMTLFIPGDGTGFVSAADGSVSLGNILIPVAATPRPRPAVEAAARLVDLTGSPPSPTC